MSQHKVLNCLYYGFKLNDLKRGTLQTNHTLNPSMQSLKSFTSQSEVNNHQKNPWNTMSCLEYSREKKNKMLAVLCNNRYGHERQHSNSELFTYICELFNKRSQKADMRKISFSSLSGSTLYMDSEMMLDSPTPLQPVEQQKRQHRKVPNTQKTSSILQQEELLLKLLLQQAQQSQHSIHRHSHFSPAASATFPNL